MPRPKTKAELIERSRENFRRLNELVDSFSEKERNAEFPKGTLNRNIKDVIAHLHEWNLMFLGWYEVGMTGEKPDMLAKDYTWRTLPELNKVIREKYKDDDLSEVQKNFEASYKTLQKLINKHSDKELFEKKRYKWTGSTSMGAYLVSACSSHYEWAFKLIKKAKR